MKNYKRAKILSIFLTSLFIITFEFFRHEFLIHYLPPNLDITFSSILFVIGAFVFSHFVFHLIEENERKEQEAKILFDNSVDGIFVFDSTWTLVDMNKSAEKISGWKNREVIGKQTIQSFFQFERPLEVSMKTEEGLLIPKEGIRIPVSVTFSVIPNDRKEESKVAVIVRDLTERKQMEEVIQDLYREATQKQMEAETQYRIARKIASLRDLTDENKPPILEFVTKETMKLLGGEVVGLILFDFTKKSFYLAAITDLTRRWLFLNTFSGLQERNQSDVDQMVSIPVSGNRKITFIPLQSESFLLGYLGIGDKKDSEWSLHGMELVKSIVNILSISFENAMLYRRTKDITILEERERLAREMHDGLAQTISSIHIKIEILKARLLGKDQTCCHPVVTAINELNLIVDDAYREVRQNLFNLRSAMSLSHSFKDFLKKYIEQFGQQTGIQVSLDLPELTVQNQFEMTDETKIHLMRILQEALSNIRRHSHATKVSIFISCEELTCRIIIEDNGIGFNHQIVDIDRHFGISSMNERIRLIQGKFEIESEPGKGTKVMLTVPIREVQGDGKDTDSCL